MKAIRLIAPSQVEVADVANPVPSQGDLLIDVEACGICGTDMRIFGHGSPRVQYPRTLGHEIVGTVRSAGSTQIHLVGRRIVLAPPAISCGGCEPCRTGRANLCRNRYAYGYELDGGFAEQLVVPEILAAHVEPAIVPDGVPSWLAALAEPISCVLNGQERLGDVKDGWVVILGAGFIGRAHNAISRLKGARTVVVDPEPARLAGIDADATVEGGGGEAVAERLKELVGDDLAAIVVANSSPKGNDLAMDVAIEQTRILLFAGCSDPQKGWPVNLVHYKELQLIGSFAALPRHVQEAVELLGGPLRSLGDDVLRIGLDEVPSILTGDRLHASAKVVAELR